MEKNIVYFEDLGLMEYQTAWDYQEKLLKENVAIKSASINSESVSIKYSGNNLPTKNHLLIVEHPAVYTLGKSGKIENVLISREDLKEQGIEVFHTNRGGDITFHGPSQIVGYPIFDLEKFYTDIGRYLRELEEVIIQLLGLYGIHAGRSGGETGVWIDAEKKGKERKICAMGVRCSRWITMHGFALNVNTDLRYFNNIVPCGIQNKKVTSMKEELGRELDLEEVKKKLIECFAVIFNVEITRSKVLS